MGNDVLETVRAQGISIPIQLVGHSLGGRVALALARAAPDPVAGVALLDIAPGPISASLSDSGKVLEVLLQAPETAPTRQQLRSFLTSHGLSAPISDWLLMNTSVGPEGCRWRFDREGLGRLHQRVNGEDLWDVVENGRVPVRCIRGDRSRYVSDEDVQRLEHAGVGVETLKNAGHYVHVEALEPLVTWLLQGPSPLSSR